MSATRDPSSDDVTEQPTVRTSYRSQLSVGEDVVDPSVWAGSVPVAHWCTIPVSVIV